MTIFREPRWRVALVLALTASLAGVLLVGVSAWFLGAVALAGLGPGAFAFGFHHPAAIVRLLALVRTTAKYGERVTGHSAALRDQTKHRSHLFVRMAGAVETKAQGWQLTRADRLQAFLGDVEKVDFARLRASVPILGAGCAATLVSVLTLFVTPFALPVIAAMVALLVGLCLFFVRHADEQSVQGERLQKAATEAIGQQLAGLVSLEGGGERIQRITESIQSARRSEYRRSTSWKSLSTADAFLSVFGPLAATVVLVVAAMSGQFGEAALPSLLAAFAWLAIGELVAPLARAMFAHLGAARAANDLSVWAHTDDRPIPEFSRDKKRYHVELSAPNGTVLGASISLRLEAAASIAILGPSGCGKTTLLKRLAGWLPWESGTHPLGSDVSAQAACHLSLHDAAILDGTVRDNLFSDADDAELWAALDAVEMSPRIEKAGGLAARISQDGLSLGEARRIALARAILTDAPVLLLDEPGEHLDPDQSARILQRLLEAAQEKTVLFVTHEARLASLADTRELVR